MSIVDSIAAINKTSFTCPHCSALTSQFWFDAVGKKCTDHEGNTKNITPVIPTHDDVTKWKQDNKNGELDTLISWGEKIANGEVFIEKTTSTLYNYPLIYNVYFSQCYNCEGITIWHNDQIIYPESKIEIEPNPDLDPEIITLFNEARLIVNHSPKGAAALLRLSLQLLCKQLGEPGRHIETDIISLVKKGLPQQIQMALDYVRVIGNESVHPGTVNLNDNREISIHLFNLINLICEQMISQPKRVKEMYSKLPPAKLKAIEDRNKKATS